MLQVILKFMKTNISFIQMKWSNNLSINTMKMKDLIQNIIMNKNHIQKYYSIAKFHKNMKFLHQNWTFQLLEKSLTLEPTKLLICKNYINFRTELIKHNEEFPEEVCDEGYRGNYQTIKLPHLEVKIIWSVMPIFISLCKYFII
jgi:hypothetical protein